MMRKMLRKRINVRNEVRNYQGFLSLIIIMLSCIVCIACGSIDHDEGNDEVVILDEVKQHEVDFSEPLIVFYEGAGIDDSILSDFINRYPEIEIVAYPLKADEERESNEAMYYKLSDTIRRHGEPDIILINTVASCVQIDSWYQEGQIKDLSTFLSEDTTLNTDDYVGGTFDVLRKQDAIMGLPLSWDMRCMVVRGTYWDDENGSASMKNCTGEELIKILSAELEVAKNENHTFWMNDGFELPELLIELDLIEELNGEYLIDEEAFEAVYSFTMIKNAVEENVEKTYKGNIVTSKLYAANYSEEAMHMGCSFWGAPQLMGIYAKSIAASENHQVELCWMPTYQNEGEYVGRVRDIVLLGGNSSRQKQAYEVIRMMMDMPIDGGLQPGAVSQRYSPINIECALQLLEDFEEQDAEIAIYDAHLSSQINGYIEKQRLSDEEKEQLQQVIVGINDLYIYVGQIIDIAGVVGMYSEYYNQMQLMEYEEGEYRQCYYEVMRALNPESEKWNLSPEEVEEFVSGER